MWSIRSEKAAFELIEAELRGTSTFENHRRLMQHLNGVKTKFQKFDILNIYCSKNPEDYEAKLRLFAEYTNLVEDLSKLSRVVFNKETLNHVTL